MQTRLGERGEASWYQAGVRWGHRGEGGEGNGENGREAGRRGRTEARDTGEREDLEEEPRKVTEGAPDLVMDCDLAASSRKVCLGV